jgi:outer membrane protein assembly factor BamB
MAILIRSIFSAFLVITLAGCGIKHVMRPPAPDPVIMKRASRQPQPRWVLPLGPTLVEDMRLLDHDRLLVGLEKNDIFSLHDMDYLLVDTERGNILWRYECAKDAACRLLLDSADLILFQETKGEEVSLVAVDAKNGITAWSSDVGSGKVAIVPDAAGDRIIAVNEDEKNTMSSAFHLKTGEKLWQRKFSSGSGIPPIIAEEAMWLFSSGVECISLKDGATRWIRTDLQPVGEGPPPQLDGNMLVIFPAGNTLTALNAGTGKSLWSMALPADGQYTNIYPYGGRIYLRGVTKEAGRRFKLYAVDAATRKLLWTYGGAEPSVSNLIESGGRLYFGTATSLTAVDVSSGKELFSSAVSTAGRAYPVHIRKIDKKVIFIGELAVAAYDAATGRQVYRHGMTPISNDAYLGGLDASLAHLKETAAKRQPESPSGGITRMAAAESARYQNAANSYHKLERNYYSKGDYYGSQSAGIQADLNRAQARNMATVSFASALSDLAVTLFMRSIEKSMEGVMRKQQQARSSLLLSCGLAETAEYVYRPHLVRRSAEDAFANVSVVRLRDGKRKDFVLSPQYGLYGLWNIIDFEKGVVYHHGIGMDPARYRYSEQSLIPFVKMQTIDSHLIAAPMDIPR